MSLAIAGMGWVTPLGSDIAAVWSQLLNGDAAVPESISSPLNDREYPVFRVSASATANAPAHPRLRRSSAISRFAVVAGLAALKDAKVEIDPATMKRTALVFAVSNGGVIYTKRFYHEIVASGAQAASPLLFPETVFNAPASHLAAILGITGASYTLVGDGAVGILALKMAEDLMLGGAFDHCLVVAAEEADWLLCDAYRKWRLLRLTPPIEPFQQPPKGMILSEGAGAVLLGKEGAVQIEKIAAGTNFQRQRDAATEVKRVFAALAANKIDLVLASANGTFIDQAEREATVKYCPGAWIYTMKPALGESVGASGLWQIIGGARALTSQMLPPVLHTVHENQRRLTQAPDKPLQLQNAIVSTCGLNQQVAGLRLALVHNA
jgi:3-oxoacyl-(acyl-carrier-protein) synthase